MHPSLVTPKSQDSETLPLVVSLNGFPEIKKPATKGTVKRTTTPKKKESGDTMPPCSNSDKDPEMGDEPKVEPMKQDFHFYAMDHYEEVKHVCRQQLDNAFANGTIARTNAENQLFLLTTLINARLIKNWESASPSTRAKYLKKEEADRKRFMSEEEVASRHCATLTARRRSPKQSGDLERAGSFGLSAVDIPSLDGTKRPKSEFDLEGVECSVKRAKAEV
ncbi:hypothetical protein ACHAXA_003652 [Cyclostephanos tholiformis]|uniref:Uncharacterized protein n=1 Tax=Cyclostephanos tholiformis TaxID=382380 RepID=A0ABD3SPC9_9STRA